jgi:hypothetical protein
MKAATKASPRNATLENRSGHARRYREHDA